MLGGSGLLVLPGSVLLKLRQLLCARRSPETVRCSVGLFHFVKFKSWDIGLPSRQRPETVLAALDYFSLSSSSSGLLGYLPGGVLRQCWQRWTISLYQVQDQGFGRPSRRRPETALVALDFSTLSSSSFGLWRKASDLLCRVQLQLTSERSEAAAPFQEVVATRRSRGVRQVVQLVLFPLGEVEVGAVAVEQVPSLGEVPSRL